MAKKVFDNRGELEEEVVVPSETVIAYTAAKGPNGKYDLFEITLDPDTLECTVERKPQKYTEYYRAVYDVTKLTNQELNIKRKK